MQPKFCLGEKVNIRLPKGTKSDSKQVEGIIHRIGVAQPEDGYFTPYAVSSFCICYEVIYQGERGVVPEETLSKLTNEESKRYKFGLGDVAVLKKNGKQCRVAGIAKNHYGDIMYYVVYRDELEDNFSTQNTFSFGWFLEDDLEVKNKPVE